MASTAAASCLLGGSILGVLSYWSTGEAARKRLAASHVENALTTTPQQLRQLALQQSNSGAGRGVVFEQYVALQGNIASDRPVRYTSEDLEFDAATYSSKMRDRMYKCTFKKSSRTPNQNENESQNSSSSSNEKDGPVGKIECGEHWKLKRKKVEMAPLNSLFLRGSGVVAVPGDAVSSRKSSGLESRFFGKSSASNEAEEAPANNRGQVELLGLCSTDLDGALRTVKDTFTPAFKDDSKTEMLKNDHRSLTLQAAGSNIVLEQNDPVRLGCREVVEAILIGDPITCIGMSRVDPKSGRMTVSSPAAPSPFLGRKHPDDYDDDGTKENRKDSRPFIVSRMDKMEIGQMLRNDASAHDIAGLIFGIPSGALLAAGILFAGKHALGGGSGVDGTGSETPA